MMKNKGQTEQGFDGGFLGIEAGGTHTSCLLTDDGGRELMRFDLGPANVRLTSNADLTSLFQTIKERTGSPVSIAAGMSGVRNDTDRRRVLALARGVWAQELLYITNDLETPLMAAGPMPDWAAARVLLLSGTGSCAYGVDREGHSMKFGGRGHILGDQGSACDIALAALRRIVYQHDLKAEFPTLGRVVLRVLQLNDPDDLIPWTQVAEKHDIAQLAVTIFQESQNGDALAASAGDGVIESAGAGHHSSRGGKTRGHGAALCGASCGQDSAGAVCLQRQRAPQAASVRGHGEPAHP